MVHDQNVHFKWHVFLYYFLLCPEPPNGTSCVDSFLLQFGGSVTNFPVPLGAAKLAINRQNFLMHVLCSLGIWLIGQVYGYGMSFCMSIWSDSLLQCLMCICTSIYLLVSLIASQYSYTSIITLIPLSFNTCSYWLGTLAYRSCSLYYKWETWMFKQTHYHLR